MHADSIPSSTRVRAGGTVLSLLAGPLCAPILRAHLDGPLRLPDLRERIGGAAQTTLRGQVGNLRSIGALERQVRSGMPYTVENELTAAGHGILEVADLVEAWLSRAPQGPVALGSEASKGAIRALVGGWDSTVLRVLSARPLSLTELDGVIPDLSYPSLERRLSAMRAARQIETQSNTAGKAKPYAVTEWTRRAVAPLVAAGRCECLHLSEVTDPLTRIDIEAAFLLAVPLVRLDPSLSGSCLLAVNAAAGEQGESTQLVAGARVEIERGEVVSCDPRLEEDPATWALGSVDAWVDAILNGRLDRVRLGGSEPGLARSLIDGLHRALAPA
jgi:DNA-binding HxlR family transcriptional regulator